MNREEHRIAWISTVVFLGVTALALLLVLDLLNHGQVWQTLNRLKSRNNSTLPGKQRTIGKTDRASITYLN